MKPAVWPLQGGAATEQLNVPGKVSAFFFAIIAQPVDQPAAEWAVVGSHNVDMGACALADDIMREAAKEGRPVSTRIVFAALGPDFFDGVLTPFQAKKDSEEMGEVWP